PSSPPTRPPGPPVPNVHWSGPYNRANGVALPALSIAGAPDFTPRSWRIVPSSAIRIKRVSPIGCRSPTRLELGSREGNLLARKLVAFTTDAIGDGVSLMVQAAWSVGATLPPHVSP